MRWVGELCVCRTCAVKLSYRIRSNFISTPGLVCASNIQTFTYTHLFKNFKCSLDNGRMTVFGSKGLNVSLHWNSLIVKTHGSNCSWLQYQHVGNSSKRWGTKKNVAWFNACTRYRNKITPRKGSEAKAVLRGEYTFKRKFKEATLKKIVQKTPLVCLALNFILCSTNL